MATKSTLWITAEGVLESDEPSALRRIGEMPGRYRLAGRLPQLVLLAAEPSEAEPAQVLMAGEVSHEGGLVYILKAIDHAHLTGILYVDAGGVRRSIELVGGAVRSAASSAREDLLGTFLVERGVLTDEELTDVLGSRLEGERIGQALVRRGLLSQKELYDYLVEQSREIFYRMVATSGGAYALIRGAAEKQDRIAVFLPLTELIRQGAERLDALHEFRKRVPDDKLVPVRESDVAEPMDLDNAQRLMLSYIDGHRSVTELGRAIGWSHFNTLRTLFELVDGGVVAVEAPSTPTERPRVKERDVELREKLAEIYATLTRLDKRMEVWSIVADWIASGAAPRVAAVGCSPDGRFRQASAPRLSLLPGAGGSAAAVGAAAGDAAPKGPAAHEDLVLQALEELVSLTLFAASTVLSKADHAALLEQLERSATE